MVTDLAPIVIAAWLSMGIVTEDELSSIAYIDIGQRIRDLRDSPPLSDLSRFPPLAEVTGRIKRWGKLRQLASARAVLFLHHADAYLSLVRDCDHAIAVLNELYDAQWDSYHEVHRRLALKRYRDLIGPDLYQTGLIP